jgi:hypothetical protein
VTIAMFLSPAVDDLADTHSTAQAAKCDWVGQFYTDAHSQCEHRTIYVAHFIRDA